MMRIIFWLLSALIIIADQVSKYYAAQHLVLMQSHPIFPGFNLTLLHNYGAAFSFLNIPNAWTSWLFVGLAIVVSIGIVVWLYRLNARQRVAAIGLSCILGGAMGNAFTRIAYSYVIDFIDVYYKTWHWPAFNIADSAICIGAALILYTVVST